MLKNRSTRFIFALKVFKNAGFYTIFQALESPENMLQFWKSCKNNCVGKSWIVISLQLYDACLYFDGCYTG